MMVTRVDSDGEFLESLTHQIARRARNSMEEMIERSLVDPAGRGVKVTHELDLDNCSWVTTYELSSDVPWGEIHEIHR